MSRITQSVIGLLLTLGLAMSPAPAWAAVTYPGDNGKVTFTGYKGDHSSIWKANADGTQKDRLVKHAKNGAWSPSGRTLAYISTKSNTLHIIKADGDRRESLTNERHVREHSPAWSPDGERIAFVREETRERGKESRSAVFSIKTNGHGETNISGWSRSANYTSPSWSPEGNKMVYQKTSGSASELIIKNLKTGETIQLTSLSDAVDSNVAWSPSGKKILYNDSISEVYTIWPDGSHRTVISDGESYHASWSPNGKKIVFLEHPTDDSLSISEEDGTVNQIPVSKEGYSELGAPVWSPNGEKLVLTLKNKAEGKSDVFTLDLKSESYKMERLAEGNFEEVSWQVRP